MNQDAFPSLMTVLNLARSADPDATTSGSPLFVKVRA